MNDHYFTPNPSARSDERLHSYQALGRTFDAYTDAGVFSKQGLDEGSALLLESLPKFTGRVLDLGCGWGAMGMALAAANPLARFILSDVNERAVALCRKNLLANGIANAEAVVSDGLERVEGAFDAIVTNPPIRAGKHLIYRLFEEAYGRLNPGGALYIVIRKQQGAPSAGKFLERLSGDVQRIARGKGYWVLRCGKGEAQ
ncbi:class I SAM-dependent methyltransferase [Bacillota bacterium Meth-B3]